MPVIQDVLDRKGEKVVTIGPDRTIADAIARLVEHGIGALLVRDEEEAIAGILTERDILRFVHAHPGDAGTAKVSEHMTRDLVYGVPEDDLDYAMSVMTNRRFRHMPVMVDGELAGIVSIGDIVKALNSARKYELRMLRDYIEAGTPS